MSDETQDGQDQDAAPAADQAVWLYHNPAGEHLAGLPTTDLTLAGLAAHGYTPAQLAQHPLLYIPPEDVRGQAALRVQRAERAVAVAQAAWDAITDKATEAEEGGPIWQALNAAEAALTAAQAAEASTHPKVDAPATGPAPTVDDGRPGAPTLPAAPDPAPAPAVEPEPPVEPPAPAPALAPEPEPEAPPADAPAAAADPDPLDPDPDPEYTPAPVGEEPAPAPVTGEEVPPDDRRE